MPKCHITGKEIPNLPKWLDNVNVKFRSEEAADTSYEKILAITSGKMKYEEEEEDLVEDVDAELVEADEDEEAEEVEEE
ncbi:MAG: hypothetical protein KatS3mg015_1879 [Fimbriimonadales bacterium]|nr:MAG: hypothetical protein KatS3mg015_1879 [Fimbriimonadales bacterium]